eukprot:8913438-Ditylum_brightwellii.AAC.1
MLTLTHRSSLSSDFVTYEILRIRNDVLSAIENDSYIIKYVGEQSVQSQTEIILDGVPPREMGADETGYFESTAKRFLNNAISVSPEGIGSLNILTVKIEQQDLKEDEDQGGNVEGAIQGRNRPHRDFSNLPSNELNRALQSSSSIGIIATITGQYQPPPDINFPVLVQDTIDAGGETFIGDLANPSSVS